MNNPLRPSILLFIDYRMLLPKAIRHPPLTKKVGQVGQVPPMMGPIIEILFNNRSGTVGAAGVTSNLCSYGSQTSALESGQKIGPAVFASSQLASRHSHAQASCQLWQLLLPSSVGQLLISRGGQKLLPG